MTNFHFFTFRVLYIARNHSKTARNVQITDDQRNAKKMRFYFTHDSPAKIRKLDKANHCWGLEEISKKPLVPPRSAGREAI